MDVHETGEDEQGSVDGEPGADDEDVTGARFARDDGGVRLGQKFRFLPLELARRAADFESASSPRPRSRPTTGEYMVTCSRMVHRLG